MMATTVPKKRQAVLFSDLTPPTGRKMITPRTRRRAALILRARGSMSPSAAADRFGVSMSMVMKIWGAKRDPSVPERVKQLVLVQRVQGSWEPATRVDDRLWDTLFPASAPGAVGPAGIVDRAADRKIAVVFRRDW
jgi:hypothetical protein